MTSNSPHEKTAGKYPGGFLYRLNPEGGKEDGETPLFYEFPEPAKWLTQKYP
jgi:hypothetical protein